MRLMFGRVLSLAIVCLCAARCGGSGSPPSSPSPGGTEGRTITITPSGASPKMLTVTQGTRVLFINNDNTRHNMTSDPHPEHDECPEINQVGLLNANQSRETGNMNTVRTCGFHDHDDPPPDGSRWTGSIVITR
jgi:plastocyanin